MGKPVPCAGTHSSGTLPKLLCLVTLGAPCLGSPGPILWWSVIPGPTPGHSQGTEQSQGLLPGHHHLQANMSYLSVPGRPLFPSDSKSYSFSSYSSKKHDPQCLTVIFHLGILMVISLTKEREGKNLTSLISGGMILHVRIFAQGFLQKFLQTLLFWQFPINISCILAWPGVGGVGGGANSWEPSWPGGTGKGVILSEKLMCRGHFLHVKLSWVGKLTDHSLDTKTAEETRGSATYSC